MNSVTTGATEVHSLPSELASAHTSHCTELGSFVIVTERVQLARRWDGQSPRSADEWSAIWGGREEPSGEGKEFHGTCVAAIHTYPRDMDTNSSCVRRIYMRLQTGLTLLHAQAGYFWSCDRATLFWGQSEAILAQMEELF